MAYSLNYFIYIHSDMPHTWMIYCNQKILAEFVGVVALCYQHYNDVPQLPQTLSEFFWLDLQQISMSSHALYTHLLGLLTLLFLWYGIISCFILYFCEKNWCLFMHKSILWIDELNSCPLSFTGRAVHNETKSWSQWL